MKAVNYTAGTIIILCSLWGLTASILNDNAINKFVGLILFTASLMIGVLIVIKGWRRMYYTILFFFILQIVTLTFGTIKFVFAAIVSLVLYLPWHKAGPNFFFFSAPHASLIQDNYYDGVSVGINLFAVLIVCVIWLMGKDPTTMFK